MALVGNLLYSQEFTSSDSILVTHSLDQESIGVQVIVDGAARADLVNTIIPTDGYEKDELTVNLVSSQSGVIQVYEFQLVLAALPSLVEKNNLVNGQINVLKITTDYTALSSDIFIYAEASSADITVTLPSAVGLDGKVYRIKKIDNTGYSIIVDADGSETIDGQTTKIINGQYDSMTIVSDNVEWWII